MIVCIMGSPRNECVCVTVRVENKSVSGNRDDECPRDITPEVTYIYIYMFSQFYNAIPLDLHTNDKLSDISLYFSVYQFRILGTTICSTSTLYASQTM